MGFVWVFWPAEFFTSHFFRMGAISFLNSDFLLLGTRTGTSSVGSPYFKGRLAFFLKPPDPISFSLKILKFS